MTTPRTVPAGLVVAAALALVVTGCSSSSSPGPGSSASLSTSPSASSSPAAAGATQLAAALRHPKHSPRPSSVACRPATAQEIASGPFGTGPQPQYTCRLGVGGATVSYDVQVQSNGCYVAERQRSGKAIYGCGASAATG